MPARPVFSVSLFQQQGLNGSVSLGPAAGVKWVIRDIAFYANTFVTATDGRVIGANAQTFFFFHAPAGGTTYTHEDRRVVIEQGQSITISTTGPVDVTISGYQLSLP